MRWPGGQGKSLQSEEVGMDGAEGSPETADMGAQREL